MKQLRSIFCELCINYIHFVIISSKYHALTYFYSMKGTVFHAEGAKHRKLDRAA